MRWCLRIIALLSIAWLIALIFATVFQCKPVAAVVDASIDGECMYTRFGFLLCQSINLALDLWVALLPVRVIWKLNLPLGERLGVCGIFLTGSLSAYISDIPSKTKRSCSDNNPNGIYNDV